MPTVRAHLSCPHLRSALSRPVQPVSAIVLTLALASCGGGGRATHGGGSQTRTNSSTTSTAQGGASSRSSVTSGPVRGTLSAQNHAPRVGRSWRYRVTATDAAGHPLSGTVEIEFVFDGRVVGHDTPPIHRVADGRWTDTLKFPASAAGVPLSFRAVVHTRLGSISLDWPIAVHR